MVFGLGKKKDKQTKAVKAPTRGKKSTGGLFSPISRFFFNIISKYSASQEEVVGIEITPASVKVAQLREQNDRWTLTKFSYRSVENGSEELLRSNPEIYVEQVQTALQIAKVDTTNAAIALPVSSAIIRVLQMPVMTDEEIEEGEEVGGGHGLYLRDQHRIKINPSMDPFNIYLNFVHENLHHAKPELTGPKFSTQHRHIEINESLVKQVMEQMVAFLNEEEKTKEQIPDDFIKRLQEYE